MTYQERDLLMKIKKAQKREDKSVEIDELSNLISTDGVSERERIDIDLSKSWDSVKNRIYGLEKQGFLNILPENPDTGNICVHLTHSGFHYWQTTLNQICSFLLKSVLVPIVVAFLTALFTVLITT